MKLTAIIRILAVALIWSLAAAPVTAAAPAQSPRWEVVESDTSGVPGDSSADKVEVSCRDGYIYVTTPRPVSIKVFTILGQLVSQGRLPAGTSRLRVSNKGIYILKTGSYTCRVTL